MRKRPGTGTGMAARIPGGPDGRRMLWINFVDKTGSGLWLSVTALYFLVVADLSASRIGLLMGLAGAVGIAGSPVAGRLADRFPSPGCCSRSNCCAPPPAC